MNRQNIFFIMACLLCKLYCIYGNLPPEIQKCNSTNNEECIGRTIEEILERYHNGNPDFNMPDITALNLTNVKFAKSNPGSPVQINFIFIKGILYGLDKLKILSSSGIDRELQKAEIVAFSDSFKMKGSYEIGGKLLLLPINGRGVGELELKETKVIIQAKMHKEQRNNLTYLNTNKFKLLLDPKKMHVNLENAFNGNPLLSQTINDVINENWKDVWTEMQDSVNHALGTIIESTINKIFEIITLEDMYAD